MEQCNREIGYWNEEWVCMSKEEKKEKKRDWKELCVCVCVLAYTVPMERTFPVRLWELKAGAKRFFNWFLMCFLFLRSFSSFDSFFILFCSFSCLSSHQEFVDVVVVIFFLSLRVWMFAFFSWYTIIIFVWLLRFFNHSSLAKCFFFI